MKKENLYQDLKRQILTMELEPGTTLDETTLSEEYQISRTPLREIFGRLAGEGYLSIVKNRGTSVSSMDHKTLRNFFMTAPMVYAAIGRLAADNARPAQIDAMQTAQDQFRQAARDHDGKSLIYWNDHYHAIMGEMADNPFLKPSYDRLLIDHARISQTFYSLRLEDFSPVLEEAASHHDDMLSCIRQRNTEGMVDLIKQHWALSHEHMEMFVRPDPLPVDAYLEP